MNAKSAFLRQLRERLCRYIARPAVAEKRLTVTARAKVVYLLTNRLSCRFVGIGVETCVRCGKAA